MPFMKRHLCIILLLLTCLTGCKQFSEDRFVLNGELESAGAEYVILSYWRFPEGQYVEDTAAIANGIFSITDTLYEPVLAKLQVKDTILSFYIEPGNVMLLNFSRSNPSGAILQGSQTDAEHSELKLRTEPYWKQLDEERYQQMKIREKLEVRAYTDTMQYSSLKNKEKEYSGRIDSLYNIIQGISEAFVDDYPGSFVSASVIDRYIFEGKMELGKQKMMYAKLSDRVKESYIGKEISEKIRCQENTSAGGIAPDFEAVDIDGNHLSLSSFGGDSYILLDFWASWCELSASSISALKEIHNRYHGKGFDIISISNEENEDEWKAAIDKNGIGNWHHIINKECTNSFPDKESIQHKYRKARFIVPVYILIDREGKVVNKWEGYSEDIGRDMENTLRKIFE